MFPAAAGANNRIEPNGTVTIKGQISDATVGIERLLLIAVQARPIADRFDFSFLAQPQLERTRSGTAGGSAAGIDELFVEAGFGGTTRGGRVQALERTEMQLVTWHTQKANSVAVGK
jgi:hypothetical protein